MPNMETEENQSKDEQGQMPAATFTLPIHTRPKPQASNHNTSPTPSPNTALVPTPALNGPEANDLTIISCRELTDIEKIKMFRKTEKAAIVNIRIERELERQMAREKAEADVEHKLAQMQQRHESEMQAAQRKYEMKLAELRRELRRANGCGSAEEMDEGEDGGPAKFTMPESER